MPTVTFITSIDCMRSAPPRSNAFQLACRNAADSTSTMEKGVSKAGSSQRVLIGLLVSRSRAQRSNPGKIPELSLEGGLQAIELRHQGISDRSSWGGRGMNGAVETANLALQRHRADDQLLQLLRQFFDHVIR